MFVVINTRSLIQNTQNFFLIVQRNSTDVEFYKLQIVEDNNITSLLQWIRFVLHFNWQSLFDCEMVFCSGIF